MIGTRRLKNAVIFIRAILSFVLSKKIIFHFNNIFSRNFGRDSLIVALF